MDHRRIGSLLQLANTMKVVSKHWRRSKALEEASKRMMNSRSRGKSSGWAALHVNVKRQGWLKPWRVYET